MIVLGFVLLGNPEMAIVRCAGDVVKHFFSLLEDDTVIVELLPHALNILTHLTMIYIILT